MNKAQMKKLITARGLIFSVENQWWKKKKEYAAETLYKARIEINNAMSRG